MNAYEIQMNGTFLWVASETSFDAMKCVIEDRDGCEQHILNTIVSTTIPEDQWDRHMFDDNRDGAGEDDKISLLEIMKSYQNITEATIIASESDD